jgi:solute carrier family 35 (adenosine 3'-phospho 5'-phosphosulfate transporter), member B2
MMYTYHVPTFFYSALLFSGELPELIMFLQYNPDALYYNIITAICSTTGQFAIFYTIKRFGPDVFTVIMTTRQMLSIVVSNYIFNHSMTLQSYVGAFIVFSVISYAIYRKIREKQEKDRLAALGSAAKP